MTTPLRYGSVQPVQFPLGTTCQGPCWAGGSGTVTVVNQDNKNYCYIGYTNSIAPGGTNTAPLGPGASMTFPGDRSLYAVGITSAMQPLLLMPGSIQYSPPQQQTAQLFTSGAIPGPATPALTLGPLSQATLVNLVDVTNYNSYDINLYAYKTTVLSTDALSVQFSFTWFDDMTSGIPVFQEDWWVWVGQGQITSLPVGEDLNPLAGCGPMHGRYLTVTAYSPGSTSTVFIQWLNIFGSPRTVPYSDWRQSPRYVSIPSRTNVSSGNSPCFGYENQLAVYPSQSLAASGFFAIPLPLYAGPVSYEWEVNTTALTNTATLVSVANLRTSDLAAGAGGGGTFWGFSNVLQARDVDTINFPRAPVVLLLNGASTAMFEFSAIAQQAA